MCISFRDVIEGGMGHMMDIIMLVILCVSFLLMKLFVDWNDKQIKK